MIHPTCFTTDSTINTLLKILIGNLFINIIVGFNLINYEKIENQNSLSDAKLIV